MAVCSQGSCGSLILHHVHAQYVLQTQCFSVSPQKLLLCQFSYFHLPQKYSLLLLQCVCARVCVCMCVCVCVCVCMCVCVQGRDDYSLWSLFLVYVGVILPELAFRPDSVFLPSFEGHENNIHCLAIAVNALAGAIFYSYGKEHQRERMKEFLVVSYTVGTFI